MKRPCLFQRIKEIKQEFLSAGAADVHLAVQGLFLFTLLRDEIKAEDISSVLRKRTGGLSV